MIQSGLGLILGPEVTTPGLLSVLSERLARELQVVGDGSWIDVADRYLDEPNEATFPSRRARVCEIVRSCLSTATVDPSLRLLTAVPWKAVLSATLDRQFEDRLREHVVRAPRSRDVIVLDDLQEVGIPRGIPVYKLVGSAIREDFAVSAAEYRRRRQLWSLTAQRFASAVRANPVLVLGMSTSPTIAYDLLAALESPTGPTVLTLVLLADDPLTRNNHFLRSIPPSTHLCILKGTVNDVIRASRDAVKSSYTRALAFPESDSPFAALAEFHDLAIVVNERLKPVIPNTDRHRLLDLLFAPLALNWDPFCHNLDFRRTLDTAFTGLLETHLAEAGDESVVAALIGHSACGKTTTLKRVALSLAMKDYPVLWIKPWYYPDVDRVLRKLFRTIKGTKALKGRRIAVCMDDPRGLGSIAPSDVADAAMSADVSILLIVTVRRSEWDTYDDRAHFTGSLRLVIEEELEDQLDEREWSAIEQYLVTVGAAESLDAARRQLAVARPRATDTLSMLYLLLPETKAAISTAVSEEYFRLGDRAALTRILEHHAESSSELLQRAYEMIAVGDILKAPVPIEVLVAGLKTDFQQWRAATPVGGAAWGLFYAVDDEEGETICYHTRNDIVAQIIVNLVNGGMLGNTGEVRVAEKMLAACVGTTPAYREFAVRVLIHNDRLSAYSEDDGKTLYDAAIKALPRVDATILHHKARWLKRFNRPMEATRILDAALAAPRLPYGTRQEAPDHIHTTYAATLLDAVNRNELSAEVGRQQIILHLARARARSFNPRAVHVQARTIIRFWDTLKTEKGADDFAILNDALADIDRLLIHSATATSRRGQALVTTRDLDYLSTVRNDLLSRPVDVDAMLALSQSLWNQHRRQDGFTFCARRYLAIARDTGRGSDFRIAHDYCTQSIQLISSDGVAPAASLFEVAAMIYYYWRVRRPLHGGFGNEIDWQYLGDACVQALRDGGVQSNPFFAYIRALAAAHLGDWTTADAVFRSLRQSRLPRELLFPVRDWLVSPNGVEKQVQGKMSFGPSGAYLKPDVLGTDIVVDKSGSWPGEGEFALAFIGFSFAGARAFEKRF